jgi:hypothetical protein
MRTWICGALALAFVLCPSSAIAAAPTILTVGQVDQHPTATWSLPAGVQAQVVEVATAPATGSDGYFFFENVKAFAVPQPTDTSWTYTYQLDPGTYYVHVAGYDTSCGACPVREFSSILTLVIPAPPLPPPTPPPPPPPPSVIATPPVISSAIADPTGHIKVVWALPAGLTSAVLQIASNPDVDSVGYFLTGQVDFALLAPGQTTYTGTLAQRPGTYYVRIAGDQPAYGVPHVWSTTTPVTVSPPVRATPPKVISHVGNTAIRVRSRTLAYAAGAKRLPGGLNACRTLTCSARRVAAFALTQRSYEKFVAIDSARPAACGTTATTLRAKLRKAEASATVLHTAILGERPAAKLRALAHTFGFLVGRAIGSSQLYVAACNR